MPLSSWEFGDITHQQLKTGHGGSDYLYHGNEHTLQISTTVLYHPPTASPLLTIYQDTRVGPFVFHKKQATFANAALLPGIESFLP